MRAVHCRLIADSDDRKMQRVTDTSDTLTLSFKLKLKKSLTIVRNALTLLTQHNQVSEKCQRSVESSVREVSEAKPSVAEREVSENRAKQFCEL